MLSSRELPNLQFLLNLHLPPTVLLFPRSSSFHCVDNRIDNLRRCIGRVDHPLFRGRPLLRIEFHRTETGTRVPGDGFVEQFAVGGGRLLEAFTRPCSDGDFLPAVTLL